MGYLHLHLTVILAICAVEGQRVSFQQLNFSFRVFKTKCLWPVIFGGSFRFDRTSVKVFRRMGPCFSKALPGSTVTHAHGWQSQPYTGWSPECYCDNSLQLSSGWRWWASSCTAHWCRDGVLQICFRWACDQVGRGTTVHCAVPKWARSCWAVRSGGVGSRGLTDGARWRDSW